MFIKTRKLVSKFLSKQIVQKKYFSKANLNISNQELSKQKAELALQIYQLILNKPDNLNLKEKSLHQLIMEKISQNDKNEQIIPQDHKNSQDNNKLEKGKIKLYHQQAKKPFIEMFSKGYKINEKIFYQPRIEEGKINQSQQKKFIFHPTYFITSQIFNQLHMLQKSKKVLIGHYGISKTVSVCLFWHLLKFIDDYRFKKGVTLSKNMMRVPKMVYLSITQDETVKKQDIRKFIIDQCPQIKENFKLTDGSEYNFQTSIKNFYKNYFPQYSEFNVIQVYDQINQLAKYGRLFKQEIQDILNQGINIQQINLQANKHKKVVFFLLMKSQIQFFRNQFDGTLYLSSMGLQTLFYQQVKMTLNQNSRTPPISSVNYSDLIFNQNSIIQLINYFLFEMNERILKLAPYKNDDPDAEKMIKEYCFKLLNEEKKEDFFFTPQKIRIKITNEVAKNRQKKIISKSKYIQETQNIFKEMIQSSTKLFIDNLLKTFQKNDKKDLERITLMMGIYNYLKIKKQGLEQEKQKLLEQLPTENSFQQFQTNVNFIPLDQIPIDPQQISNLIDKRIFSYYQRQHQITLLLPSTLIIKVLEPFTKKYSQISLQITLDFLQKHGKGSHQGIIFQNHFNFCLNKGNVNLIFKVKESQFEKQDSTIYFSFQHDAVRRFLPLQKIRKSQKEILLNQKKQSSSQTNNSAQVKNRKLIQKKQVKKQQSLNILQRFQSIINDMIKLGKREAVLFPVKKNYLKQNNRKVGIYQIQSTSKLVDIVFLQNHYSIDLKIIKIWLFDLTVDQNETKKKIQDFITHFLQLQDRNTVDIRTKQYTRKVQLSFLVLSPKNQFSSLQFAKELNKKFQNKITFDEVDNLGYLTVKSLEGSSNQCLLKRVGWIDIETQVKFSSNNQQVQKQIQSYEKILNQIVSSRKISY